MSDRSRIEGVDMADGQRICRYDRDGRRRRALWKYLRRRGKKANWRGGATPGAGSSPAAWTTLSARIPSRRRCVSGAGI